MNSDIFPLPDLAYEYAAFEPHISGRIMELHHDKHHAAYVKGANTALVELHELREKYNFATLSTLRDEPRLQRVRPCPALGVLDQPLTRRRWGAYR